MKKNKLIKEYFVSEIIKKPMTTKSDLEFLMNKLGIDVKINWLRDADPSYKGAQIINTGNNIIGGKHWTASYNGMYFDSFGMVLPPKFEEAGYEWYPLQIQGITEGFCGNFSILFLYYAKMGELDQFYNQFTILN